MMRRIFLVFTLALLFGLGQQGAAVHAVSHLADWQQSQQQPDKGQHKSTCDKCVAYAQLGGAVGSQHVLLLAPEHSYHRHTPRAVHAGFSSSHPYSARAPPSLA
ncbi:MAG TPA: hypothetical protein PKW44_02315 [Methylophilaceae bacterium]|nr:hypothetical protein [Methylophilaceae bacterium]HQR59833.1 hypothetical protein [Methylophilaceae bacterium]